MQECSPSRQGLSWRRSAGTHSPNFERAARKGARRWRVRDLVFAEATQAATLAHSPAPLAPLPPGEVAGERVRVGAVVTEVRLALVSVPIWNRTLSPNPSPGGRGELRVARKASRLTPLPREHRGLRRSHDYASGSSSVNTEPPPWRGSYQRSPPIARALCLASDRPRPVELSPCVGFGD